LARLLSPARQGLEYRVQTSETLIQIAAVRLLMLGRLAAP
jgi:hypothetical protein